MFEAIQERRRGRLLAPALMNVDAAFIADKISSAEQHNMLALKRIDRARSTTLNLRNTLNKIAHYKIATFRVDGRGAHYLLLEDVYRNQHWVAEILVSKRCQNAAAAIQGIAE